MKLLSTGMVRPRVSVLLTSTLTTMMVPRSKR
ncbi:hypothetical protein MyxoNM_02430 [Myxococcus xanthus]|nr:hypothetical protein MyxoNM_02430 [Myxococcus xanthus]